MTEHRKRPRDPNQLGKFDARKKFDEHVDLLSGFTSGPMAYEEFAARVLRRFRGEHEGGPVAEYREQHGVSFDEAIRALYGD